MLKSLILTLFSLGSTISFCADQQMDDSALDQDENLPEICPNTLFDAMYGDQKLAQQNLFCDKPWFSAYGTWKRLCIYTLESLSDEEGLKETDREVFIGGQCN